MSISTNNENIEELIINRKSSFYPNITIKELEAIRKTVKFAELSAIESLESCLYRFKRIEENIFCVNLSAWYVLMLKVDKGDIYNSVELLELKTVNKD